MSLFNVIKHLLPDATAWSLTIDKQLRQFFKALSVSVGDDFRQFYDDIYDDLNPQTTRFLDVWEKQFGLPNTIQNEQACRDRLDAAWKALGGQSPRYIQDTLQGAGFNVFIHEWWELPLQRTPLYVATCGAVEISCGAVGASCGAKVDGSPRRVPRNPLLYLRRGTTDTEYNTTCGTVAASCGNPKSTCGSRSTALSTFQYTVTCGAVGASCDAVEASCGASLQPTGFPLVNKIFQPKGKNISCGSEEASCGNESASCGSIITTYSLKEYVVPEIPSLWPYFLYIGGEVFPEHATVPSTRKNEFETLCLKICPGQQWLGMLIDYN